MYFNVISRCSFMPSSLGESSCPLPKSRATHRIAIVRWIVTVRVMTLEGRDIRIQSFHPSQKPGSKGQSSHNQGGLRSKYDKMLNGSTQFLGYLNTSSIDPCSIQNPVNSSKTLNAMIFFKTWRTLVAWSYRDHISLHGRNGSTPWQINGWNLQ